MDTSRNNPYVGPRTFEEEDSDFFHGRERESRDLLAFVISEPLVLFYAQSGAGKSSLINTRLIPGLRQEGFEIFSVGRVSGEIPVGIEDVRNIYTFNLLANLQRDADPAPFTQTILTDYLEKSKTDDFKKPRVLIIDQFEEITTTHPGRWQDREDFFWQLQTAIQHDPLLWVVLTMREDHIAALDPYAEILPGSLRARFHMQRLKANAAQQAIEKPATQAGKPFDKGVAQILVKNLSQIRDTSKSTSDYRYGEYIEPVQLQVVCFQLWENLNQHDSSVINEQHLLELGNVDKALADFYNQAVESVVGETAVSEVELRKWFDTELITEAHTRGTVYQGEKTTAGMSNEAVNQLTNRFLLRADRRAGGVWFEIVHDRFVDPILQANQTWRDQQSLVVQAAIIWDESGRTPSKLYLGDQLKDTLATIDSRSLTPLARTFLRECGKHNQAFAEQEEQRQRELKQAKELAEAEQKRAESEAKNAKRFSILAVMLGILIILIFSLAIFTFDQRNQAIESELEAQENLILAETSAANAVIQASIAAIEKDKAITAQAISEAQKLDLELQSTKISQGATRSSEALETIVAQDSSMQGTATMLAATAVVLNEKVILDVPYLSQNDPTASSHIYDGGATSLAMLLNSNPYRTRDITTDQLYSLYLQDIAPNQFTDVPELPIIAVAEQNLLLGRTNFPTEPINNLKEILRRNKPVIIFVDHTNLRNAGSDYSSRNNQNYMVVVGFDFEHIYVHDPASMGCFKKLRNQEFISAWAAPGGSGNEEYRLMALIPEGNMGDVSRLSNVPPDC